KLVEPFDDPEVGCVGGELRHIPPQTPAERQAVRLLGEWQQFAFSSNPSYAITANAAYRHDVLEHIGSFDPHMTRAQDVELGLRFHQHSDSRLAFGEGAIARHRHRSTQLGFFRQQLGWAYGAGLVGAKFEALGGDKVKPPRVREIGRTARGLGIVVAARARGGGGWEWVEDPWFDLMRQFVWWPGPRAGLIRGSRIWRSRREAVG